MSSEYGRNLIKKYTKLKDDAEKILIDTEHLESTVEVRKVRRNAKQTINKANAKIRNWSRFE